MAGSINNVFYDFHCLVACVFGEQRASAETLRQNIADQAKLYEGRKDGDAKTCGKRYSPGDTWLSSFMSFPKRRAIFTSYNCMVASRVGVDLCNAVVAFFDGDYDKTTRLLVPIRHDCQELLGGSHAQKDIVDLMMIRSAIRCNKKSLAKHLLAERIARCREFYDESLSKPRLEMDRLNVAIMSMH